MSRRRRRGTSSKQLPPISKRAFRNWEFPTTDSGSQTPKWAFDIREGDPYDTGLETLYDIANLQDSWALREVLGEFYQSAWRSTYRKLGEDARQDRMVTVYRSSDIGGILPGAFVTESLEYAIEHGRSNIPSSFQIYQMKVHPSELMSYRDPHEFLYIPTSLDAGYNRYIRGEGQTPISTKTLGSLRGSGWGSE
jgi:hypothetical protein